MSMACSVVHKNMEVLECKYNWKYSEYNWLLGSLKVRFTNTVANGVGDGDGDNEQ